MQALLLDAAFEKLFAVILVDPRLHHLSWDVNGYMQKLKESAYY